MVSKKQERAAKLTLVPGKQYTMDPMRENNDHFLAPDLFGLFALRGPGWDAIFLAIPAA